jgi:hypothetical protein
MYLFFVRAFNDIDHLTPVVWKMSRDNYPVAVYCINPEYDILNDYRLNFLKQLGVKVDHLYNHFGEKLGWLHRTLRYLFSASFAIHRNLGTDTRSTTLKFLRGPRFLIRLIGQGLYKFTRNKYYTTDWAKHILEQTGARTLCFDWIKTRQFVVNELMKSANDMSIPVIALPHGVYVYTNDFVTIESRPLETYEKLNRYDRVIVQNKLYKELMANFGLASGKILILGSARYCNEWLEQNKKILPRKISFREQIENKLKIVFMTTRPRYRVDMERMFATFDLLAKLDGIEVLVKPHTRTKKEAILFDDLPVANAVDISSVELCEWADVVLVIGSSIILESLVQGKPALYLKYLHENTTLYEEFGACWTIHDEDELRSALLTLQNDRQNVPYSAENSNRFISDIVYGGPEKRDVLKDYVQFIVNF